MYPAGSDEIQSEKKSTRIKGDQRVRLGRSYKDRTVSTSMCKEDSTVPAVMALSHCV